MVKRSIKIASGAVLALAAIMLMPAGVGAQSNVVPAFAGNPIDPVDTGLWAGVNIATLGPPANSLNTQVRRACGYPAYTTNTTAGGFQDDINNGLTAGVNLATTGSASFTGSTGCNVSVNPGSTGQPGQVVVNSNPGCQSTTSTISGVKYVNQNGSVARVCTPNRTITSVSNQPQYVTSGSFPSSSYTTTGTTGAASGSFNVVFDPWYNEVYLVQAPTTMPSTSVTHVNTAGSGYVTSSSGGSASDGSSGVWNYAP